VAVRASLSPTEAADRLAIRELFDAYAHCADRRDAEAQKRIVHRRHPVRCVHELRGDRADLRHRRPRKH